MPGSTGNGSKVLVPMNSHVLSKAIHCEGEEKETRTRMCGLSGELEPNQQLIEVL